MITRHYAFDLRMMAMLFRCLLFAAYARCLYRYHTHPGPPHTRLQTHLTSTAHLHLLHLCCWLMLSLFLLIVFFDTYFLFFADYDAVSFHIAISLR